MMNCAFSVKLLALSVKKLQACKPDSVVGYHLSVLNITVGLNLPTLYRIALLQT
jgi:hypothetical protein